MLRYLLPPRNNKLSRGINLFYALFGIALLGFVFVGQLTDTSSPVEIPIHIAGKDARVIDSLPGATVVQAGVLQITHPSFLQRILAPANFFMFDLVHCAWILCVIVIGIVYFRRFDYREPFTRQSLKGMRLLCWVTMAFWIIGYIRQPWFTAQVNAITGGKYHIEFLDFFITPEFWVFILLQRIVYVFRRGYQLSQENQYTV